MPTGDLTASDKASESNSILHQATRASVPGLTGPLALSGCLVADPMATTQAEATISLPPSLKRLYHWRRLMPILCSTYGRTTLPDRTALYGKR